MEYSTAFQTANSTPELQRIHQARSAKIKSDIHKSFDIQSDLEFCPIFDETSLINHQIKNLSSPNISPIITPDRNNYRIAINDGFLSPVQKGMSMPSLAMRSRSSGGVPSSLGSNLSNNHINHNHNHSHNHSQNHNHNGILNSPSFNHLNLRRKNEEYSGINLSGNGSGNMNRAGISPILRFDQTIYNDR